ncbi:MAG: glycoside hydrolase family 16 protein [Planctomycetia bacterium]|nr:glycoside hydrolase family 16 protein [Planctomycetia bacterium]
MPRLRRFACLLAAALSAPLLSAAEPAWRVVWEDEFAGPALDWSKWEIEVNAFGGGNNELQLYTDRRENVRVEDGRLVIEARRDKPGIAGTQREFSSGRIRSKRRGDWLYGKVEVRARVPVGQGIWPAIWMLPSDDTYGTWAASGEIDIMEIKGEEPNLLWGTLHHGGPWPDNRSSGAQYRLPKGSFADDFHTFAIEWEKGRISWLVDGVVWQTQTEWNSTGGAFPAPFDKPFHLVINLAVGGGFVGAPDPSTPFPGRFEIDFVRVSQQY